VWDAEAVRHIISGLMVPGHRCRGCPREVVVQHFIQALIERIDYDGPSGTVAVTLRTPENSPINRHALAFEYRIPSRRGGARPASGLQM
jgi:hypothetical protein